MLLFLGESRPYPLYSVSLERNGIVTPTDSGLVTRMCTNVTKGFRLHIQIAERLDGKSLGIPTDEPLQYFGVRRVAFFEHCELATRDGKKG